ncbi:MAG: class I SAM-dependent methyltransferase [Lachnospira sp.]
MKYDTEIDFGFNNTMTIFIENIQEGSTVLEFGPASGRLTRYLKNEKKCNVYIVEIDEEAGRIAAESAVDYVIGDIQDYEWMDKFSSVRFDYILFADVLEHLTRAEEVMKKAGEMLADDGKICLSVPNIAHNSVVINLLNNKFDYTKTGIMDNTHVHFYTKDSLDKFVADCGFYVEKRYATYTQVGKNEFSNSYEDVSGELRALLKARRYGEVYQYVYVISQNPHVLGENHITEYADYTFVQVFFDRGEGYGEYKRYPFKAEEKSYSIELEELGNVSKVRLDPVDESCVISNVKAVGTDENGNLIDINILHSNADYIYDDNMVFAHNDPQFQFEIPEGITKLTITYCIEEFVDCNDAFVKAFKNIADNYSVINKFMISEEGKNAFQEYCERCENNN